MKVKRYEEAEKVKMKADLLEEFERNKLEAEVSRFIFNCHLDINSRIKAGVEVAARTIIAAGCLA